ncbi:MAG: hypothetical protein KatS3mg101_0009 [Patescibacteria group bacterium]|nr:MAG: hypothetical protein KatS3mg101_0009 [Patescibacteria group bacterium]
MRKNTIKNSTALLFSNEPLLSKIYVFWALVAVFLYGLFGIGNLTLSLIQKINLYKQMTQINYDLNVRLQKLAKLSEDLESAQKFTPVLASTVPEELNTHSYMVDFMQQASIAGFSVKNFVVSSEGTIEGIPITAILEGNGDLATFVSGLEGFRRVTVIDSVILKTLPSANEVTVNLRIFNL